MSAERLQSPRELAISPRLVGLTLDDFPAEWSFGNGVTLNARVHLKDGEAHRLSWVVFDDLDAPFIRANFLDLCEVVEGPFSR